MMSSFVVSTFGLFGKYLKIIYEESLNTYKHRAVDVESICILLIIRKFGSLLTL